MSAKSIAILGCGGMGLAIARRLGVGRRLFVADFSNEILSEAQEALKNEGYTVEISQVDVSDYSSVSRFAQAAASHGPIEAVIHTAGLSPSASCAQKILEVNLLGTANALDAFLEVAQSGTSMVCIASMAGHMGSGLPSELEHHLATTPRSQLLDHVALEIDGADPQGSARAYGLSKRGNLLRVQASSKAWGRIGGRVNSVSPGVISTGAGRQEINGPAGKFIALSPVGRVGTPQDIVNAVSFLISAESSFITGSDILVDGGVVPSLRWDTLKA
ncbi:short-chain type dehydrogenase/reductase [Aspergillus pseudoustus]|uniref:Short-chain type dehydrogenase/reductase n=1 Tax=Aspergillus pseudoustus TaxID=1810923 RepID=A0ABR4IPC0_9EURO